MQRHYCIGPSKYRRLRYSNGVTHTVINVGLGHRTAKIALVEQYIPHTLSVNMNDGLAIRLVYWGLIQWLVEQVRTF
jgi:hypothetical protein